MMSFQLSRKVQNHLFSIYFICMYVFEFVKSVPLKEVPTLLICYPSYKRQCVLGHDKERSRFTRAPIKI